MRNLDKALSDHELIVLRVIGEWLELDLTGADKAACVVALTRALSQLDMAQELQFLAPEEAQALRQLAAQGGQAPVAGYSRDYGRVRQMGPGRLEREEPWLDPASPAEALWYRGFLYQGFDESDEELFEFYYLPPELMATMPESQQQERNASTSGGLEPATAPDQALPATTDAVDDLATILCLAMEGALAPDKPEELAGWLLDPEPARTSLLLALAREQKLLHVADSYLRPTRQALAWLKLGREAQLRSLVDAWSSSYWNDLCHTPRLSCEGDNWSNDPLLARTTLIDGLPRSAEWLRLSDLVRQIKEGEPDFQRPDGNYDTWYIREEPGEEYLAGFDSWDRVEGRLLRFMLLGPLFWLGMTSREADLGEPERYRLTARALSWLAGTPPAGDEVRMPLVVRPDATLLVPYNASRYHRFQASRIAEALPVVPGKPFRYRLTPRSLQAASERSIPPERVLSFLAEVSGRPLPASVKRAVERYAQSGVEGRLEAAVILRVADPAILDTLSNNPRTRDYIGERLGQQAALVQRRHWRRLLEAVAALGLLLEKSEDLVED